MLKFFLLISLMAMVVGLSSCAPNDDRRTPELPERSDGKDTPDKKPSDNGGENSQKKTNAVYGQWEGSGKESDGTTTFKITLNFSPGQLILEKECSFSSDSFSGSMTIDARATTTDEENGDSVVLSSSLSASSGLGGQSCSIQVAAGLEFLVRDNQMFIRSNGKEKITSFKKRSE